MTMLNGHLCRVLAVGYGFSAFTLVGGCFHFEDDCMRAHDCPLEPSDGCTPSKNTKPVDDTCGVFVSSSKGADGATGTKSAPLKMLAEAITKANGRPVYACAEAFAPS